MQVFIRWFHGLTHFTCGWFDVTQDIVADMEDALRHRPEADIDNYKITDSVGFAPLKIPEKYSIDDLVELVELAELAEEYGNAFLYYVDYVGIDNATEDDFLDAYAGEWDSEESFAEDQMDGCCVIPDHLANYFDYKQFAYDLFISDYYMLNDRYVFRGY